jgi:flagellar biosynthesis protein
MPGFKKEQLMDKNKNRRKPGLKYAAALRYKNEKDGAPRVVALGKGTLAEKIVEAARQNKIPLHKDPELVCALSTLEVGQEIPFELYQAVAEVLAFVLHLDKKKGG